jgi:hypothetical protein
MLRTSSFCCDRLGMTLERALAELKQLQIYRQKNFINDLSIANDL